MSEGKVKAIYDALDNRNYKLSLKLCTAYLAKPKNNQQLVQVLKALTLERMGKSEEAEHICKEVKAQTPTDPQLLDTLVLVYKSLGKVNEITSLYEVASSKNPKNEALWVGLFNSYVRQHNFQKQNQVAMNLWKQFHKEKYLMWAIMSLVLQAGSGPNKLLELAQKMMEKVIAEDKVKDQETVYIYLEVLQQQQDFKKIVDTLNQFSSLYKLEEEKLRFQGEVFTKISSWKEAVDTYRSLLLNYNADDWSYWCNYLTSSFNLSKTDLQHDFVADTRAFIKEMQSKEQDPKKYKRGPFLAEIELEHRLTEEKKHDVAEKLLIQYFTYFGDKSCCYSDMKLYLQYIGKEKVQQFSDQLQARIQAPTDDKRQVDLYLYKLTTFHHIKYSLGLYSGLSVDQLSSVVANLLSVYKANLDTSSTREATELTPIDGLLILAAYLIQQSAFIHNDLGMLMEALLLLEYGLEHSKYNFQMKIMAIGLYCQIGAIYPAVSRFHSLDVKHILFDTISYLILDDMITLCATDEAIQLCRQIKHFHDDNTKTTSDFVIRAYTHGSFSKIREFMDFKHKLECSEQLAIANTELVLLELFQNSNSQLEAEAFLRGLVDVPLRSSDESLAKLQANQDFSLVEWPLEGAKPLYKVAPTSAFLHGRPLEEQLQWIKLRSTVPQLLLSIVQQNQANVATLLASLRKTAETLKLQGEDKSFLALNWNLSLALFEASDMILQLASAAETPNFEDTTESKYFKCIDESMHKAISSLQALCKYFTSVANTSNVVMHAPEYYTFVHETTTWSLILLDLFHKYLPASKKKKAASNVVTEVRATIKKYAVEHKDTCQEVQKISSLYYAQLRSLLDTSKGACKFVKTDEFASVAQTLTKDIAASYEKSSTNLQRAAEAKTNAFKAIKF